MRAAIVVLACALCLGVVAASADSSSPGAEDGKSEQAVLEERARLRRAAIEADARGDVNGAVRLFKEALDLEATDSGAWNNYGVSLMRRGRQRMEQGRREPARKDFVTAASAFRSALKIDIDADSCGDNLRAVLRALERNFRVEVAEEDLNLLEEANAPYSSFDPTEAAQRAHDEDERIRGSLGIKPTPASEPRGRRATPDQAAPETVSTTVDPKGTVSTTSASSSSSTSSSSSGTAVLGSFASTASAPAASASGSAPVDPVAHALERGDGDEFAVAARFVRDEATRASAVQHLCQPHFLRLRLSRAEHVQRAPSDETIRRVKALLDVCGVALLDDVLDPEFVDTVRKGYDAYFEIATRKREGGFFSTSQPRNGEGRMEVRMPLKAPFQSPDLTMHYILQPLIHAVLGSSIALDTLSTVTTPPTAPTQLFRRDADFLFAASEDAAPAHALVVELPLADLPPGMEGTSFLAGSQLGCDARAAVADARVDAASILCPAGLAAALVETTPSVGNVLLYDARVLRRQHANNSPFRHASFLLRYVRDWFFDASRTQEHQHTPAFASLDDKSRRLLERLDFEDYLRSLEVERGIGASVEGILHAPGVPATAFGRQG